MPGLRSPRMRRDRATICVWVRSLLAQIAGPDAAERAPFLMATAEGLLLHRLTVDPEAPIRAVIEPAVRTALQG